MEVLKIYNNNIIAVLLDTDQIALVTGKGIGFEARGKSNFQLNEHHQLFTFSEPNKMDIQRIIDQINVDALEVGRRIVERARELSHYPIMDSLLLQLSDHISFKVELFKQHISVPNLLMTEVKVFYPIEFAIGSYGVQLINEQFKTDFTDDEAAYLALHVLNSSIQGKGTEVYKITEFISGTVKIIEGVIGSELIKSDWHYERLLVHLKFLAQRLLVTQEASSEVRLNDSFFEKNAEDLIKAQQIVTRVNQLSEQLFAKRMSADEEIYLSLHVLRML